MNTFLILNILNEFFYKKKKSSYPKQTSDKLYYAQKVKFTLKKVEHARLHPCYVQRKRGGESAAPLSLQIKTGKTNSIYFLPNLYNRFYIVYPLISELVIISFEALLYFNC